MSNVKVRFAPSPTGPLHIGGVRTALYNYLFAKKHGGEFLLRIEDTDQTRFVPGAEEYIMESLAWLGISPSSGYGVGGDKGPYKQSERKEIYRQYALNLIQKGHAYYAFDSAETLENLRKTAEEKGEVFTYGVFTRETLENSLHLSGEEVQKRLAENVPFVIRFKTEKDQTIKMMDLIRGDIQINSNTLDDKVLYKSDGMPTYHLANIVDDHLMEITHVIRGEEWLPSMALHICLYKAFGWEAPQFAHLPLLLKPEGKGKLSKRDGDKFGFPVFPLAWKEEEGSTSMGYREEGYFPEATLNMLALLGWNPGGEEELFSLDELSSLFDLEKVSKSGARFNLEKAQWFNHQYLQKKNSEELLADFKTELARQSLNPDSYGDDFHLQVIESLKERANFTKNILEEGLFFYEDPTTFDEKALKKATSEQTPEHLLLLSGKLESSTFDTTLHDTIKTWIEENALPVGKIMQPLRLSLVGKMAGPDVFEILLLLGKETSLKRISTLRQTLL